MRFADERQDTEWFRVNLLRRAGIAAEEVTEEERSAPVFVVDPVNLILYGPPGLGKT